VSEQTNNERTARLDLDRTRRIDLPEAVYCQGKTTADCVTIVSDMLEARVDTVVATRISDAQLEALSELNPDEVRHTTMMWRPRTSTGFTVALAAAGTSDLPVAAEARLTLESLGHTTRNITDVGVAGLHRLHDALGEFEQADLVITFAGMEGALPTVLAGLIPQPIISVPTSVGYGSSFEGITALLGSLASCAPGIMSVGIDNGYGAACAAHRILASRS
jgi:NCAIR mutase (PurE)-related protein